MWTEKDRTMVQKLLESTQAGKMDWSPTAYQERFTASLLGKHSFQIQRDFASQPDIWLNILDAEGDLVHTLGSDDYAELRALFELARRKALKVDDTIDNILADLDKQ